jgi:hypothetical protein
MVPKKLYVVRTYVMATGAAQAIRRARGMPADDAYVDDDWARATKAAPDAKGRIVGFSDKKGSN